MVRKLFLAVVALLAVCACDAPRDPRPTITVTIEPLRYFAEQIGGDRFRVVTMVPRGANPETYEPTAQQMADLSRSDLYIEAGDLGFERTWMKRLRANASHLIMVDTSEGIDPLQAPPLMNTDPHTWTSPANALRIAQNIYNAMRRVCSKDSAYFKARLDSLTWRIIDLDAKITDRVQHAPVRSFIIYHPTLSYFARDYDFEQLPMEREGHEPTPASLKALVDTARQRGTRLIFVQREFSNRGVESLAVELGANVVEINPLSYDWESEMLRIADALCNQ